MLINIEFKKFTMRTIGITIGVFPYGMRRIILFGRKKLPVIAFLKLGYICLANPGGNLNQFFRY